MTVPAPDLRDRLARELARHAMVDRMNECECGVWVTERGFAEHRADTVMRIVQPELDQWAADCQRYTDLATGAESARQIHKDDADQYEEQLRGELDVARATIRRLNYRCQQHESKIAAFVRLVGNWRLGEKGTYVPLRNLTAIAKLAGREIDGDRYELHYQRVDGLEDAVAEAVRVLQRATTRRGSTGHPHAGLFERQHVDLLDDARAYADRAIADGTAIDPAGLRAILGDSVPATAKEPTS